MKIKTKELPYEQVIALPRPAHRPPQKPSRLLGRLVRILGAKDLKETGFSYTEERMEAILGQMEGVGKLRVMLTLAEGPRLLLASDSDVSTEAGGGVTRSRLEPLTVNRGSGTQEVVVTHQLYPVYLGAVVVCQGADSSAVRLAVTEAVAALTGLSSDRISVVKWKQS